MGESVDIDLQAVTPEEAARLRNQGVRLPTASNSSVDPSKSSDYVDNRLIAVGFGIYLGGYHLYCTKMGLPIILPDSDVDFGLTSAAPISTAIFPDRKAADAAVLASGFKPPMSTPFAYYSAAGGAIIAPTIFSPATTPRTIATMVSARRALAASVQQDLVVLAISLVGGMILRSLFARIVRVGAQNDELPPAGARMVRLRPVKGTVNVGGTGTAQEGMGECTNLNPIDPNSGGAQHGIPNLVRGRFEDIGEIFEAGSVQRVASRRLRWVDVKQWQQAATGAARVMSPGGTLDLNVWTSSQPEVDAMISAFQKAGFRNVRSQFGPGPGTMIFGSR